VSAPIPAPPAVVPPPQRTPQPHPTAVPPPSKKGKEKARARLTPSSAAADDPKYLIPFYDTRLGKAFGDLEKYARLYPHSYEAGEFRRGAYNVASFTPGHLHPDVHPSPSYAQAASGSGSGGKGKGKAGKPPSPQLVASAAAPPVKTGLPPFQVPNDASLLLASPLPLTQTLSPSLHPFLTSLLASSAHQTASSLWGSLLQSTLVAVSP